MKVEAWESLDGKLHKTEDDYIQHIRLKKLMELPDVRINDAKTMVEYLVYKSSLVIDILRMTSENNINKENENEKQIKKTNNE